MIMHSPLRIKLALAFFVLVDIALIAGSTIWYFNQLPPTSGNPAEASSGSTAKVHYHANFRVYLERDFVNFDGDEYMEELLSCSLDPNKVTPEERVHLHENKWSLVHVHDAGATWGHLMSNLGWNFWAKHIVDRTDKMYQNMGNTKVRYVLNGKLVKDPQNLQIRSEDRLLMDYSRDPDAEVLARAESVPATAHEQNSIPDPVSCGGHND